MGGITVQPNEIAEVLNRPISQELLARDVTRLAYVAKDGTPRNVPIGFTWNGAEIVMCTTKNARKLPALRKNPTVALTIDTEVHPKIFIGQASWTSSMASRTSISRRAAPTRRPSNRSSGRRRCVRSNSRIGSS
jgi:nitroimidazol reductase NimA-like FMN-containing flavoprotein (pyridoxamine 5'-phosphate oxidase superfamily)